jgi:hypothetical protein
MQASSRLDVRYQTATVLSIATTTNLKCLFKLVALVVVQQCIERHAQSLQFDVLRMYRNNRERVSGWR